MGWPYDEIGVLIKEKREKAGVTQEELAAKVNLSRTSITNIEKGKQHIQIDTLYEVATIIGVNVNELLPPDHKKAFSQDLDDLDAKSRKFVELARKEET